MYLGLSPSFHYINFDFNIPAGHQRNPQTVAFLELLDLPFLLDSEPQSTPWQQQALSQGEDIIVQQIFMFANPFVLSLFIMNIAISGNISSSITCTYGA